ncbi:MAG: hypothetical protein ABIE03_07145 [Patescibacteria group bacterium]|nr:hypothetical protein [Patescibacteria group bacterium]
MEFTPAVIENLSGIETSDLASPYLVELAGLDIVTNLDVQRGVPDIGRLTRPMLKAYPPGVKIPLLAYKWELFGQQFLSILRVRRIGEDEAVSILFKTKNQCEGFEIVRYIRIGEGYLGTLETLQGLHYRELGIGLKHIFG